MKHLIRFFGMGSVLVWAITTFAQTDISPTKPVDRDGKIIVSDPQAVDVGIRTTTERQRLSTEVKDLLRRFEKARDAYLKEQEDLRKKERGASTETERERARAQIKASRDAWLERSRALREEFKDRAPQLREQMPTRKEILDAADLRSSSGAIRPDGTRKERRGID